MLSIAKKTKEIFPSPSKKKTFLKLIQWMKKEG